MAGNKDLKEIYDKAELKWHPGFNESLAIVNMYKHWKGKKVLEIGCGEGHLASMLAYAGAEVTAVDYSEEQIKRAVVNYNTKRAKFMAIDYHDIKERFDILVMQGVLEHFDDPKKEFKWIIDNLLTKDKSFMALISVPHWWNPRGFILHTLRLLYDAKISLTDLHYFYPGDISRLAAENNMQIREYLVTDESWGSGVEAIADLADRIPKACPHIPSKNLDALLVWLKTVLLDGTVKFEGLGATAVYKLVK